ncbi:MULTISPECIES: glycosyltransferase [unclassified Devosia]|uniref:glycosyltransferase n=1 Tax=unclassified Devosia TaxID=196773 RepID=UPI001557F365
MILVTVGTQLPFDRLVAAVDELAPSLGVPVFGQVGRAAHLPSNMEWAPLLASDEFARRFAAASTIVAHAGIGTVLMAQRWRKPIILVPRRAGLGEHRNDHQLATCSELEGRPGIYVARQTAELADLLGQPLLPSGNEDDADNRQGLIEGLRQQLRRWS